MCGAFTRSTGGERLHIVETYILRGVSIQCFVAATAELGILTRAMFRKDRSARETPYKRLRIVESQNRETWAFDRARSAPPSDRVILMHSFME